MTRCQQSQCIDIHIRANSNGEHNDTFVYQLLNCSIQWLTTANTIREDNLENANE